MKSARIIFFFLTALLMAACHDRSDLYQTDLPPLGEGEEDRLDLSLPAPDDGSGVQGDDSEVSHNLRIPPGGILDSSRPGGLGEIVVEPSGELEVVREGEGSVLAPAGGEDKVLIPAPDDEEATEKDLSILTRKDLTPSDPCEPGVPLDFRQYESVRQDDREINGNIFTGEPVDILLGSQISVPLEPEGGYGGTLQWSVENLSRETSSNASNSWRITTPARGRPTLSINGLWIGGSLPEDDFPEELDITLVDDTCPQWAGTRHARFNVVRPRDKLKNLWVALEFHQYTGDYISDADSGSNAIVEFYINRDVAAHVYYDLYRCQGDISRCTKPKKVTLGARHSSGFGVPTEEEEAYGEFYLDQLDAIRMTFYDSDTGRWTPGNQEMDVHLDKVVLFSPFWKAEYSDYTSSSGHNHRFFGADVVYYAAVTGSGMSTLQPNTWEDGGNFLRDIWHPLTRPHYSGRNLETAVRECSEARHCDWDSLWR